MPITATGLMVKQARLSERGTVHADSVGPHPTVTLLGSTVPLASLVKFVSHGFLVVNPPAAQLFKQSTINKLASSTTIGTATSARTQATKTLIASSTVLATAGRAKLVSLAAGFNLTLPATFVGVGTNARISTIFSQGKTMTGTSLVRGASSKRVTVTMAAALPVTVIGTLSTQAVRLLRTVSATATATASKSLLVGKKVLGVSVPAPTVGVARSYTLLGVRTVIGRVETKVREGVKRLVLRRTTDTNLLLTDATPPEDLNIDRIG